RIRNAMNRPSGDHVGSESCSGSVVSCIAVVSPIRWSQISRLPARLDANAIVAPSRDHDGARSTLPADVNCVADSGSTFACTEPAEWEIHTKATVGMTAVSASERLQPQVRRSAVELISRAQAIAARSPP